MKKLHLVTCLAGLALVGSADAEIVPGAPFAHNMVLQRGMKVPVWGTAAKSVRYLYQSPWKGSVYNQVALPLGSFQYEVR